MHLTGLCLLLCVSMGAATPLYVEDAKRASLDFSNLSDLTGAAIDQLCSYCAQHPDQTELAISKTSETLNKDAETTQIFANTLQYFNQADNRKKLTNGTSACTTFFNDIKGALVADLTRSIPNVQDVDSIKQNILESFGVILNDLVQ